MRQIKIKLKTFRDNRVGQSLTEYAIILAVFVILLLGANVNPGGWNGGGNGYTDAALEEGSFTSAYREGSGGGGGATAVYTAFAGDGQLSSYSGRKGSILGVAGGSSGANYEGSDGYGVGTRGGNGNYGGTQTTGYAFGRGESATGARRIQ